MSVHGQTDLPTKEVLRLSLPLHLQLNQGLSLCRVDRTAIYIKAKRMHSRDERTYFLRFGGTAASIVVTRYG